MLAEARAIDRAAARHPQVDIALAPPFPLIGLLREAVTGIGVGGQDCHTGPRAPIPATFRPRCWPISAPIS
jgi:hypothetical protein